MPNGYLKVNYKEVNNVYVPTKETVEALYLPLTGTNGLSGNIIPNANKTVDLGSTTNKFKNIYAGVITGEVIHAPTLATNEIEPDTNTKLVISGGTSNEVDIQSNVGLGGNLTIGSSTNTVVITPTTLTLNATAKTAWQTELGITEGGLTQEQADDRYLQLTGGTVTGSTTFNTDTHFTNIVEFSGASDVSFENGISVLGRTLLASGNVTIDNTGQLNLQTATLTQWQQMLEIPKFVVSDAEPSDTNVIWLQPVVQGLG